MSATQLGRYRLLDRLGQGGMATVYRASDPQLGRDVAVKVMHPFIADRSEAAQRFEREARAVAGLHHPNVMQLHDYHPAEGERPAYLVMELLSGPSLRAFIDQKGTPFAEVGAIIGLRVAQALEAAHAHGIIHRDVKPENVMFDLAASGSQAPRVVLCDFGIARLSVDGHTMTATGAVIGSPVFMSPEQARGEAIDARSDLFSLGSLLYTLATGSPPFASKGGAQQPLVIMNKIAKGDHSPPTAANPRVPGWLERAIERCLKLDPADRFPNAKALVEALGDGLRADGLGDLDGELAAYLRDPPAYNERLPARLVAASLDQLRRAVAEKRRARALSAASRILAWEPAHAEALGVVDKLDPPRRRWWVLATAAALTLAMGAGGLGLLRQRERRQPPASTLGEATLIDDAKRAEVSVVAPAVIEPPSVVAGPAVADPAVVVGAAPSTKRTRPAHVAQAPTLAPAPASPTAPSLPPAVPATTMAAAAAPDDTPGELTVAISPWCDLTIDGTARGRAPLSLKLSPGPHHVECRQPSGAGVSRDLTIAPGKAQVLREKLFAAARISPQLSGGAQLAVDDGAPAVGAREATPGRHRMTLYRNGQPTETRWLDVRPEGCRLVDTPELACEKP